MIGDPSSPELGSLGIPPPARCRSCARTIASGDAYCPYCGKPQSPAGGWLYHPITLIILAFFVLGALVIPLVVRSPYLGRKGKTILSISIIIYTILVLYLTYVIAVQFIHEWSDLTEVMGRN